MCLHASVCALEREFLGGADGGYCCARCEGEAMLEDGVDKVRG